MVSCPSELLPLCHCGLILSISLQGLHVRQAPHVSCSSSIAGGLGRTSRHSMPAKTSTLLRSTCGRRTGRLMARASWRPGCRLMSMPAGSSASRAFSARCEALLRMRNSITALWTPTTAKPSLIHARKYPVMRVVAHHIRWVRSLGGLCQARKECLPPLRPYGIHTSLQSMPRCVRPALTPHQQPYALPAVHIMGCLAAADPGASYQPSAICGHSFLAGKPAGPRHMFRHTNLHCDCRMCEGPVLCIIPTVLMLSCKAQWIDASMPLGGNAVRTGDTTFRNLIAPHARFMASRSGAKVC